MKMIIKALFLLSLILNVAFSQTGNYPAAGLYVGISSTFLANEGNALTEYAENKIENTPFNDISGNSGGVSYNFHGFKVAITLDGIFYNELNEGVFQIGWDTVSFNLQWNYHICDHVCEDGTVTVFTQQGSTVSVATNLDVVFNTTSTTITAVSSEMTFDQGAVSLKVHCYNTICIIPVSKIANEVASQFVTQVQNGITNGINENTPTIEALLNPIRQLPEQLPGGNSLWVNLEGQLVESSDTSTYTPTLTAAFNGGIILENSDGNFIYPTQNPTFVPTASQLESFTSDYCISATGFFFESVLDAGFASVFPLTITPSEVPAASPVQLNTSDGFFSSVAPGLASYPNQPIQVNLYSPVTPIVSMNSTGIALLNFELSADFVVINDGNPFTAFSTQFLIDAELGSKIYTLSSTQFSLNSTLISMYPNATILSSTIGSVDPSGFVQLMQMFQAVIKIPSFAYTVPSTYSLSNLNLSFNNQLMQITLDLIKQSNEKELKISKNIFHFN
ncbi:hypothetical protein DICPUDRAFT_56266 [Dictyostelium purpureum]|uniref:Lipid-binding serum glycoprotein C-terminal domain-containing protein n=1 Tax=Dictyostelium purpureum TaxID=5786 RepID=F0ZQG9_DICPU|nr:uncharacterized protein DICPUDRAFT_56266 [Dictyostelium purpureum]EGC33796.1 hypothetical protein DICPUDRAFT_56266 [Dictyostelium purpureum]|eukprot:XP_003289667.1 hypothetical protein DICPUDRAFT_56266 [Dictyostelium purpureum]